MKITIKRTEVSYNRYLKTDALEVDFLLHTKNIFTGEDEDFEGFVITYKKDGEIRNYRMEIYRKGEEGHLYYKESMTERRFLHDYIIKHEEIRFLLLHLKGGDVR